MESYYEITTGVSNRVQYYSRRTRKAIFGANNTMIHWYFVCCALSLCLVQAELDVLFEDGGCVYTNDKYIEPGSCSVEVEDDSEYGTSLTTHFNVIKSIKQITALGNINSAQMGEYTNDLGLHIEVDLCEALVGSASIASFMFQALGLSSDNCPPKPGEYGKENFVIDGLPGLPESFPPGNYLLNITLLTDDEIKSELVTQFHLYLTIL